MISRNKVAGMRLAIWQVMLAAAFIYGCAHAPAPGPPAEDAARAKFWIDHALPRSLDDRSGWASDLYASFVSLRIPASRSNVCAVAAIIAQESGFQVNPRIPGLSKIAWAEIDARASEARVPPLVIHELLKLHSANGRSYEERINHAQTEKDLSDLFEDLIAGVPLGRTLFADRNPIRTRGPMQVHVAFAGHFTAATPYPYPIRQSLADELFTRRGGLYFGVAHLLDYIAPYGDSYLYRFADFNAGQYASRNAAFQNAVSVATGVPLALDGALLAPGVDPGTTEISLRTLYPSAADNAIHEFVSLGKSRDLEQSQFYRTTYTLAERRRGPLPRAVVPHIELHGPKISRRLTTAWYAERVEGRFSKCMSVILQSHAPLATAESRATQ